MLLFPFPKTSQFVLGFPYFLQKGRRCLALAGATAVIITWHILALDGQKFALLKSNNCWTKSQTRKWEWSQDLKWKMWCNYILQFNMDLLKNCLIIIFTIFYNNFFVCSTNHKGKMVWLKRSCCVTASNSCSARLPAGKQIIKPASMNLNRLN